MQSPRRQGENKISSTAHLGIQGRSKYLPRATIAMPYTLLQTLNYLAATNRPYFLSELSRSQPTVLQKRRQPSRCHLVICHRRASKGRKLLVFKTTGPGKKAGRLRNLRCGQGDCWVCGKLLGKSVGQALTLR